MSVMTTFPMIAWTAGGALIASPSSVLREQVLNRLNGRCRPVQQVVGGADALAKLEKGDWQLLFLDRRVPDLETEELIAIIQRRFPGIQVVLMDSDAPPFAMTRTKRGTRDDTEMRLRCASGCIPTRARLQTERGSHAPEASAAKELRKSRGSRAAAGHDRTQRGDAARLPAGPAGGSAHDHGADRRGHGKRQGAGGAARCTA